MTDTKKSDAKKSPTSKKSRPRVHGRVASRNRPDLRRDSMETTKYGIFHFLDILDVWYPTL